MFNKSDLGIAVVEDKQIYPFGKQSFFFEDMINACSSTEISVFFFSPLNWSHEQVEISGFVFEKGKWKNSVQTLPDLIYDRSFSSNNTEKEHIEDFKKYSFALGIKFLNPLPLANLLQDKVGFHKFIGNANIPTLDYIPSKILYQKEFYINHIGDRYYIKPIFGSKGEGIFVIELLKNKIILFDNNGKSIVFHEIQNFIDSIGGLIDFDKYFVQEEANIIKFNNSPFDIRVIVQNYGDCYKVTGMGVRLGKESSTTSNLNSGGSALPIEYLDNFYSEKYNKNIFEEKEKIINICLDATNILREEYGDFVEIAYDILLTVNNGPVILEGNSKPSRWIFNLMASYVKSKGLDDTYYKGLRTETVKVPIIYSHYLMETAK